MNRFSAEGWDNYADQAKLFADLELQSFLSNPEASAKAITENVANTRQAVLETKDKTMRSLANEIEQADSNVVNTSYYLARSKDLLNLAKDVDGVSDNQLKVANANKALSVRQNEINEWSNFSKLELLYFMQVIFISLSLFGFFAFLMSAGFISSSLFWTLVSIVSVVDLLIIIFKWRFTKMNRDGRYWHKMRFASQPYKKSSSGTCS